LGLLIVPEPKQVKPAPESKDAQQKLDSGAVDEKVKLPVVQSEPQASSKVEPQKQGIVFHLSVNS
jgi:hypothetical protein